MSEVKVNKVSPRSGTTLTIGDSGDTTNVVGTLQNNGAALVGDISSVVAGTNLSGGGTSGAVTINLADASTSAKGASSFSSDNFAASSGAITIKDLGVATAEIQDDAVTADKLANSINAEITANTAKTTNATHSGEVTGATALTIADNIVDEANLKVSNNPTNGYFLSAQSGNTGGMTWAAAGVTGKTIRAVSAVQDTTDYSLTNSGFSNFGSGISYTPATTSSQVMAFIDVVVSIANDSSDNDARTPVKFGTNNAAGNTIYESSNTGNNIGYTNIDGGHVLYNGLSTVIGTCQRNSSNNVVVVTGCVTNQDSGTTATCFNQRAVFMEIE